MVGPGQHVVVGHVAALLGLLADRDDAVRAVGPGEVADRVAVGDDDRGLVVVEQHGAPVDREVVEAVLALVAAGQGDREAGGRLGREAGVGAGVALEAQVREEDLHQPPAGGVVESGLLEQLPAALELEAQLVARAGAAGVELEAVVVAPVGPGCRC